MTRFVHVFHYRKKLGRTTVDHPSAVLLVPVSVLALPPVHHRLRSPQSGSKNINYFVLRFEHSNRETKACHIKKYKDGRRASLGLDTQTAPDQYSVVSRPFKPHSVRQCLSLRFSATLHRWPCYSMETRMRVSSKPNFGDPIRPRGPTCTTD